MHDKTMHLQLLPAPLVVGTTCRSTSGPSLIGDTILHILNTVPVRTRRVGPTGRQRQVLVQQHRMHYRPTIRGQLGQFTIIGLSVNEPQGIMPCRIGGWQPFKGMQAHATCPPSGQGVPGTARTYRKGPQKGASQRKYFSLAHENIS